MAILCLYFYRSDSVHWCKSTNLTLGYQPTNPPTSLKTSYISATPFPSRQPDLSEVNSFCRWIRSISGLQHSHHRVSSSPTLPELFQPSTLEEKPSPGSNDHRGENKSNLTLLRERLPRAMEPSPIRWIHPRLRHWAAESSLLREELFHN